MQHPKLLPHRPAHYHTRVSVCAIVAAAFSLLALTGCHSGGSNSVTPRPALAPVKPAPVPAPSPAALGSAALAGFKPTAKLFVSGPKNVKHVALTFDAGADATAVPLILSTLKQHNVHCTFFLTGAFCTHFPEQCKAIAEAGMEIGNHSFHHPKLTTKSDEQVRKEIRDAEEEIIKVCGRGAKPLFRYPYGDSDRRVRAVVAAEGYQGIHWTLDSLDSVGEPKSAEFVTKRILSKIKPGAITLMHVSRTESAKSLPAIFDYLDKNGIDVVPVSVLLTAQAPPK